MAISNSQYDKIMRKYEEAQIENRHLLNRRRDEIYSKIPEYEVLEKEVAAISVEHAKRRINGDLDAIAELRKKIKAITEKKKELLLNNGYAEDYLSPIYTCVDCKDTGYIDGKKCKCLKQEIIRLCYAQSNIEELLLLENFDNLSYEYYNDSEIEVMRQIVSECKGFVRDFDTTYSNILFYGNVGVGKTYLTNCIAKELLDSGHSVIYFSAFQLFDTLAKYVFHASDSDGDVSKIHDDIFNCDLLIIDDLGTETTNSFVSSQLFLILNERNNRKKSTIISTNLSLDIIAEKYSERNFSRIFGNYRVIKPDIQDLRIKIKKLNNRK